MGNKVSSATHSTTAAGIDSYVSELGNIQYQRSLGISRFMKTIRGHHKEGTVVVKIFVKPEPGLSLKSYMEALEAEHALLLDVPNAFSYQRLLETERAGYLVRQYFYSSLYDRISIRPFLNLIEKKWITYQILRGVHDSHARGIYHGDIKTENIQMTTWNWAFITDFAGFKPTFLPEDNPADFSFFFDTSSRRTCYVAPERFYRPGSEIHKKMSFLKWGETAGELTPAMDIFSVGCVIAELFLEGTPIFSLSQMFKYRNGEYDPSVVLEKIEDPDIRQMVKHMIQLDPDKRLSAEEYLTAWPGQALPSYFHSFLHSYINSITEPQPSQAFGAEEPVGNTKPKRLIDSDEKIEILWHDFPKICEKLGLMNEKRISADSEVEPIGFPNITASTMLLPPGRKSTSESMLVPNLMPAKSKMQVDDGSLIVLSLLLSLIRNVTYPSSKLMALDMILAFGQYSTDEVKLDRLVPFIVALLTDDVASVRAAAIKSLTQLLCIVNSISPINARIFHEYITPSLRHFATDSDVMVRAAYAGCVSLLAEAALKFLEMAQLLKSEGLLRGPGEGTSGDDYESDESYETILHNLHVSVQDQVTGLLIDPESSVKRSLLQNITTLAIFFGRQKANDVLLSHMITYLNDPDWMLRCAFFESIIGVGTFVGSRSLEEYILPLMIQSLSDAEEFVVEKVLNSLTSLAELGLFQKMKIHELVMIISPLLCHPSIWIRYGAVAFIASTGKLLPPTDVWCVVYPIVRPFLKADVVEINELHLLENVKSPISRQMFELTILWSLNASERSYFWKQAREKNGNSSARGAQETIALPRRNPYSLEDERGRMPKTEEDEQYLEKLRSISMTNEDEDKLIALRDYIWKHARVRHSAQQRGEHEVKNPLIENQVILRSLGVQPENVFLEPTDITNLGRNNALAELAKSPEIRVKGQTFKESSKKISAALRSKALANVMDASHNQSTDDLSIASKDILTHRNSSTSHIDANDSLSESPPESYISTTHVPFAIPSSQRSITSEMSNGSPSDLNFPSSGSHERKARKSARMQLMSPSTPMEKAKAIAELGMSNLTAVGTMEIPAIIDITENETSRRPEEVSDNMRRPPVSYVSTTYSGTDRNLRKLLEKKAIEAFPNPMPELGPKISSMHRLRMRPGSSIQNLKNWKPQGILVAHFIEHKGAINQICVAPDHNFFASCSDDGTVKIWDSMRLERNVTNRSRLTYSTQGGRIKCMSFIHDTYSIISASDNGSIHIFRVDYDGTGSTPKYSKCHLVRKRNLVDEHIIAMEQYNTETKSILLFATSRGNICAMDLSSMEILWKMKNTSSYGVITSIVTDRRHTWLLVGTSRGIVTLYDIRFQIQLRSWVHPSKSRISRMILHPSSPKRLVVIAAGRDEMSVWDVEKATCREVFCCRSGEEKGSTITAETYRATEPLGDSEILRNTFTTQENNHSDNSIRAIVGAQDGNYFITGGSGRKIRYWDHSRIENSGVVLGFELDEYLPRYVRSSATGTITLNIESPPPINRTTKRLMTYKDTNVVRGITGASVQQQQLLRNHLDAVTDIQLMAIPYPVLISGDREGVIKVIA